MKKKVKTHLLYPFPSQHAPNLDATPQHMLSMTRPSLVRMPANEQSYEDHQNLYSPSLRSLKYLSSKKRKLEGHLPHVEGVEDGENGENGEDDVVRTADMRILSAFRRAVDLESGNIDTKKYENLLNVLEGQQVKHQSSTMIQASEKMMGLLFDVKEKLTNEEYINLTAACQSIYHGDAAVTIGRAEDGRERTIHRSNLQKMQDFVDKLNLARKIHGEIIKKKRRLEELRNDPQSDTLVNKESSEVEDLKSKHRILISQAHCYLLLARCDNDHDSLLELVNYASLNISYLFTLYDSKYLKKERG